MTLCYRTIRVKGVVLLGRHVFREVSVHTSSLADYTERIDRDDDQDAMFARESSRVANTLAGTFSASAPRALLVAP